MSIRTRIEFWTGERLGYETADELGIAAFTGGKRPLHEYLKYARVKQRKRDDARQLWILAQKTGNKELWFHAGQSMASRKRNRFWRKQGYPNLRRAWAKRRENAARRRAEKELEAEREKIRKQLEQYGYIR